MQPRSQVLPPPPVKDDYCYKGSYGRGVGTIPTACEGGKVNSSGLCYTSCRDGYNGGGPTCWQACPNDYISTGAFCHIDKPLTKSGERTGFLGLGLSCPSGYTNAWLFCALNTPPVPPGFSGLTGLDIIRSSYGRGVGTIPTACNDGKENDTGLCYQPCKNAYSGVGPVCWNTCPNGYVNCGVGCATSSNHCASVIVDQVSSPIVLAANAATGGVVSSAIAGFKAVKNGLKLTKATAQTKKTFDRMNMLKKFGKAAGDAKTVVSDIKRVVELSEAEEAEEALRIASGFDPSGISQVVEAFAKRVCNE